MVEPNRFVACLRDVEQQSFADLLAGIAMAPLNTDRFDAEWADYVARLDLANSYMEKPRERSL